MRDWARGEIGGIEVMLFCFGSWRRWIVSSLASGRRRGAG